MPVDVSHLKLLWPPRLFAAEAQALLADQLTGATHMGWLLAEAFAQDAGYELFLEVNRGDGWDSDGWPSSLRRPNVEALVQELLTDPESLPRYQPPRYFSKRNQPQAPQVPLPLPQLQRQWATLINQLDEAGYFELAFGSHCLDSDDDPATKGQAELSMAVGFESPIWPFGRDDHDPWDQPGYWSQDLFLDLVEALHDYVARPRERTWHSFHREWDYSRYARTPGQDVYRWKVNALLAQSALALQLADNGENRGRLIAASGDARENLIVRVQDGADADQPDEVGHAIELFRRRGATAADKRSAITTLYGVLEPYRAQVREKLGKTDEGVLFGVANQFGIRHRGVGQKTGYDDAFLDWMFWSYLATVELLDHLLSRPDTPDGTN